MSGVDEHLPDELSDILPREDGRTETLLRELRRGDDVKLGSVEYLMEHYGFNPTQARRITQGVSKLSSSRPDSDPEVRSPGTVEVAPVIVEDRPDDPDEERDEEKDKKEPEDMAMAASERPPCYYNLRTHPPPIRPHGNVKSALFLRNVLMSIGLLLITATVFFFLIGVAISILLLSALYVVFAAALLIRGARYYQGYRWEFCEGMISARGAVFPAAESSMKFSDISHIEVTQSWAEYLFDLYTIRLVPKTGRRFSLSYGFLSSVFIGGPWPGLFSISGIKNVDDELSVLKKVLGAAGAGSRVVRKHR